MNNLPKITSYGEYSSDNYGVNSLVMDLGDINIYYSYKTIVAYSDGKDGLVCSENVWSNTTGKHLNWIQPDKTFRINNSEFMIRLENALKRHIN